MKDDSSILRIDYKFLVYVAMIYMGREFKERNVGDTGSFKISNVKMKKVEAHYTGGKETILSEVKFSEADSNKEYVVVNHVTDKQMLVYGKEYVKNIREPNQSNKMNVKFYSKAHVYKYYTDKLPRDAKLDEAFEITFTHDKYLWKKNKRDLDNWITFKEFMPKVGME